LRALGGGRGGCAHGWGGGAQAWSKVAAGMRLLACGCAHAAARTRLRARGRAAARSEQGCGADGAWRLRAQNKATARTGQGSCSNVAGRRRAQGARRGAATRMCISQNAAINCNLMCILKFSNVCFSNHRMLSKGYDTFNCNQMCILKFISRACVYVHTRKVRLVSRIALDQ